MREKFNNKLISSEMKCQIKWTEVWVEFLSEAAASKGVDKSCSINVIKGDQTLLIIHKHPHLLRLRLQRDTDWRVSTSFVFIFIP